MFVSRAEMATEIPYGIIIFQIQTAQEVDQFFENIADIRWVGFVGFCVGLVELIQDGFAIAITGIKGMRSYVISGHRRFRAYQRLGMSEIPSTVCEMTDEEATVAMVDANLHRDHILPSEKAFAYEMKLDAIKRQGESTDLTSAQLGQRLTSVEKIAAESDESKTQIQRYISLTRLIPELLQMVDEGRIALTPAVELSKLHWQTQQLIYEICDMDDLTPSYSQTVRMRKLADEGAPVRMPYVRL